MIKHSMLKTTNPEYFHEKWAGNWLFDKSKQLGTYNYGIFFVCFDIQKTTFWLDQNKQSKFLETNSKFVDLGLGVWSDEQVKFIYSEKATIFCEIFTLLLTVCTVVKSKVKISQIFEAFSEYVYEL